VQVIVFEKCIGDRDTILSTLSDYLLERGIVKSGYREALIKRENVYPTGIKIKDDLAVAIPHTDVEYANENAIVICLPQNEVYFQNIEDPNESIKVSAIFLLVISNPSHYVKFLSNLTMAFQREEFLNALKNRDVKALKKIVEEAVPEVFK